MFLTLKYSLSSRIYRQASFYSSMCPRGVIRERPVRWESEKILKVSGRRARQTWWLMSANVIIRKTEVEKQGFEWKKLRLFKVHTEESVLDLSVMLIFERHHKPCSHCKIIYSSCGTSFTWQIISLNWSWCAFFKGEILKFKLASLIWPQTDDRISYVNTFGHVTLWKSRKPNKLDVVWR